jgi:F-type H+-transporting ATPase subunit epsilon
MPLHCIVVTPERTVRDEEADFVALTLFDGEIGIAPGHTPLVGRLGYGEMRITRAGNIARYYVEGGFVEVADDVVSVLTQRAVPPQELDPSVAEEQLREAAAKPATSPELMALRDRLLAQGRAQLRVARRGQ